MAADAAFDGISGRSRRAQMMRSTPAARSVCVLWKKSGKRSRVRQPCVLQAYEANVILVQAGLGSHLREAYP